MQTSLGHGTLRVKRCGAITAAVLLSLAMSAAQAQVAKPYYEFKLPRMTQIPGDISLDTNGMSAPVVTGNAVGYVRGFEGVSQYDGATFGRNFIPPDTMGAVGKTQYFEVSNGAYAVYDKATGARQSLVSDVAFWTGLGQAGANGDTRVMYNSSAQRWVAIAFGNNTKDIQIAVSNTSDALGGWKATQFEGYAGLGFGATADYPTLAMDRNAVYIGTNNFAPATSGGTNSLRGTTLNVIPMDSLFNATAPTTTNMKQFVTPYSATSTTNVDAGFAIQGVNSFSAGTSGKIVASSLFVEDNLAYKVNGLSSSSATGSTTTTPVFSNMAAFTAAGNARQPAVAVPANQRVVTTGDERISSSVYEVNGRIYMVNTVNTTADGLDEARVRYTILDSNTFAIISQGDIGEVGYDSYMGSIAVNEAGQVVIGYNRSSLDVATGKISFMARTFDTAANGTLVATSGELLLKTSLTDDYHNGATFGLAAVGRQRWGDYSQVSVDPEDPSQFYLIGEFAREYNNDAGGHPGGTGGSRWGTWIAVVGVAAVPEPSTWMTMFGGAVLLGAMTRRRRS